MYKTIKIGEQTWMAENLSFAYSLPTSNKDSSNTTSNKQTTNDKYGKLYRWSIAMDSAAVFSLDGKGCGKGVNCDSQPSKGVRGICPQNWHIPNETDIKNIIGYNQASNDIWIEHYWFLTENEDNEFKTEMKLKYDNFWTSAQIDENNAKGLGFVNNVLTTTHSPKGLAFSVRCVKDDEKFHVEHGTMTDERDGQVYKTVKIGNQWWMAENLNYDDTQNTENINSSCYNNEPDNCAKYGRLYNWRTAMGDSWQTPNFTDYDFKWHVPSFNEWNTLVDIVNNYATDLKSKDGWLDDGNGADSFGFNALPAGYYNPFGDEWASLGELACFWTTLPWSNLTSFKPPVTSAFSACISSDKKDIFFYYSDDIEDPIWTIGEGLSLRCVKDE